LFAQDIARGSGDLRNDRGILAAQQIQQTGFAGVGFSDDNNLKAVAQNPALLCLLLQQRKRISTFVEAAKQKIV